MKPKLELNKFYYLRILNPEEGTSESVIGIYVKNIVLANGARSFDDTDDLYGFLVHVHHTYYTEDDPRVIILGAVPSYEESLTTHAPVFKFSSETSEDITTNDSLKFTLVASIKTGFINDPRNDDVLQYHFKVPPVYTSNSTESYVGDWSDKNFTDIVPQLVNGMYHKRKELIDNFCKLNNVSQDMVACYLGPQFDIDISYHEEHSTKPYFVSVGFTMWVNLK